MQQKMSIAILVLFTGSCLAAWVTVAHAVPILNTANGHYYERVDTPRTWDEARVEAASITHLGVSGHLVTFQDAAEQAFVISNLGGSILIGMTDSTAISSIDGFDPATALGTAEFGNTSGMPYPAVGQTPSSTVGVQRGEGWAWITGEPMLFQSWLSGEPNDLSEEDAGTMSNSGEWIDGDAGSTLGQSSPQLAYVVEFEPISVLPEPSSFVVWSLFALLHAHLVGRRRRRG